VNGNSIEDIVHFTLYALRFGFMQKTKKVPLTHSPLAIMHIYADCPVSRAGFQRTKRE